MTNKSLSKRLKQFNIEALNWQMKDLHRGNLDEIGKKYGIVVDAINHYTVQDGITKNDLAVAQFLYKKVDYEEENIDFQILNVKTSKFIMQLHHNGIKQGVFMGFQNLIHVLKVKKLLQVL